MRAGWASLTKQLPSRVAKMLGKTNARIIDTLVNDLILAFQPC